MPPSTALVRTLRLMSFSGAATDRAGLLLGPGVVGAQDVDRAALLEPGGDPMRALPERAVVLAFAVFGVALTFLGGGR